MGVASHIFRMSPDEWLGYCNLQDAVNSFPECPIQPYRPQASAPNDAPAHDIDWLALNRELSGGG